MNKYTAIFAISFFSAIFVYSQYYSKETKVAFNILKYFINDINPSDKQDLMIGSSSIFRLNTTTFLKCGNWINRGLGSSTLTNTRIYIDYSPSRTQYSRILIYAGENDLASKQSVDSVFIAYKRLLATIERKYKDSSIHLLAIKPSPIRAELFSSFEELNTKLNQLSLASNKVFFHSFEWPKKNNIKSKYFTNDNIHLTNPGYIALTKEFNKTCTS